MAHVATVVMRPPRHLYLLAGLLCLTVRAEEGSAPSWIESLHLTASGSASWVNNHSRTSFAPNRKDAATYELNLGSSQPGQLAPNLLCVTHGEINALSVPEYKLAESLKAGGRVSFQRKFGLGPMATVLQANVGASYKSARLDDDTGWTTDAGVQLSKRVHPSLRLMAGVQWLEHNARSAVFDLNQHSYSIEVNWDITQRWSLYGSVGRLEGDIVTNMSATGWYSAINGAFGPAVKYYYTSRPWSVTNIYGPGWVSYNVEADVDLWSASLSYAISDHTTVELRQSAAYVVSYIGVSYPTDSISLSLIHRF